MQIVGFAFKVSALGQLLAANENIARSNYEKTARSFLSVLCLAATADWLNVIKLR